MKKNTSTKPVWSTDDLHKYLDEAVHSFKAGQHLQQVLIILTSGSKKGDSEMSEFTYPLTSLEVTRRIQIVRDHLMTIPRRRLSGGTEGKTITPEQPILQQISDILNVKTPVIQAASRCRISRSAWSPNPPADHRGGGRKRQRR
jgi:hypothetical protein